MGRRIDMSDRLVFVPYPHEFDDDSYEWADIVIDENARTTEICRAARQFVGLPGPHKVFLKNRKDKRFKVFTWYLKERLFFSEERGDYSVREACDSA